MPWNETTRREYARHGRRYASDLTDREWALVAPFLPAVNPGAIADDRRLFRFETKTARALTGADTK